MRIGSLFSGAGGLDMAVQKVFGGKVVWHCENDPAASKVLEHHWPMAHNLNDITKNDFEDIAPTIDVLCGGWPCQPFSLAGKRKGIDDDRALWPHVARAIRALRPRYVVLENVAAVLRSPEFDRVANSLAANGYRFTWTCLRASDVGAPHRRERLFIVATDTARDGRPRLNGGTSSTSACSGRERVAARSSRPTPDAHTSGDGRHQGRTEPAGFVGGSDAAVGGDGPVELLPTPCAQQSGNTPENHLAKKPGRKVVTDLAILVENGLLETGGELLPTPTSRDHKGANQRGDETCLTGALLPTPQAADGARGQDFARANRDGSGGDDLVTLAVKADCDNQWGKYAAAISRWEQITGPAPSPTELNTRGNPRLAPAFSEWMMGWPTGHVTQVPSISRNDQLRIIGNGVCVQQCVAALQYLLSVAAVA